MMKTSMRILRSHIMQAVICLTIFGALALAINLTAPSAAFADGSKKPPAKNIIIMISDGWGFNHLEAASYYEYGKDTRQIFNRFPFNYAMSTYMAYDEGDECYSHGYDPELAWNDFDYVRECPGYSPASATAMSTGVKTYRDAIGVDLNQQPLGHALELAEQKGKATGVVTSVEWSHATPAGFVAHNVSRNNYVEIAQEMVYDSAVDVIMGCGHPWYDSDGQFKTAPNTFKYVGGETTWNDLVAGTAGDDADGDGVADPWLLIQERAAFQALANGPTPKRVIGTAQVYQTLQQGRGGDGYADPYLEPLINNVPTLEEMTKAALNILDDDPDGLFLMVEGGAVDWASHDNQSGRMIEEQIDFENAVEAVVTWVRKKSNWGETLLIVTSDHETGYLTGPGSDPTWAPIVNNGAGNLPGMEWHSGSHTNSLVALSAKGSAARMLQRYADGHDPVHGPYVDNTELSMVIFWAISPQ
jgi:alkaline phosphatase